MDYLTKNSVLYWWYVFPKKGISSFRNIVNISNLISNYFPSPKKFQCDKSKLCLYNPTPLITFLLCLDAPIFFTHWPNWLINTSTRVRIIKSILKRKTIIHIFYPISETLNLGKMCNWIMYNHYRYWLRDNYSDTIKRGPNTDTKVYKLVAVATRKLFMK